MLRWSLGFLIVALSAAIIGFGGIATEYAAFSRTVFLVFISLFTITLGLSACNSQQAETERDDELTSD